MMARSVDSFTICRGVIIANGWTSGRSPKIIYRGKRLKSSIQFVERPDVVAAFGRKAARWGFQIAAATDSPEPLAREIAISFGRNDVVRLDSMDNTGNETLFGQFVDLVKDHKGGLLEIGSRARSGNVYKSAFPDDVAYTGMDVLPGPNVDVVGDAHHLSRLFDCRFDFAFSISVFEHLLMPWKVAIELNKVLNMGAVVYNRSHQSWPVHESPWDFWRFSDHAWHGLFNVHTGFEIVRTEMTIPGFIAPNFAGSGALSAIDGQPAFLSSSCIARKIAEPLVQWDAEVSGVYDTSYTHA